MPLYIPTLVFGTGAVQGALAGFAVSAHLRLLVAMLILALVFAPWATAAALKVSLE
jgi:heme exporter protein B